MVNSVLLSDTLATGVVTATCAFAEFARTNGKQIFILFLLQQLDIPRFIYVNIVLGS
jgi:hypothetical protein